MWDRKVLNWDQNDAIARGTKFIVPSLSILFPVVDVYLKAETQVFIAIDRPGIIFTVMPGLLLMF